MIRSVKESVSKPRRLGRWSKPMMAKLLLATTPRMTRQVRRQAARLAAKR